MERPKCVNSVCEYWLLKCGRRYRTDNAKHSRTFVRWAVRNQHLPRIEFPYRKAETRPVLDQNERLRLLRETLDNHHIPLHHRAAAVLLLLYAQPLTRIAGMRCEHRRRRNSHRLR
jgi:hypothetical protein